MIYFTLPNFFEYFAINQFFIDLNKKHPEYFKEKVVFKQVKGSFPYCSWSGYNSNFGQGAFYSDFEKCYKLSGLPIRFDFSNVLLEEFDFYDNMANTICSLNENGSNLISVANIPLQEYLKNKYPNYNFIFSREADLITEFTPDILNTILDSNQFSLIELPYHWNKDVTMLKQLHMKSKYEIVVNSLCPLSCKENYKCKIMEHQNQLDYSQCSIFNNCFKANKNYFKEMISLEEIKQIYVPLGFSYFTFAPFQYGEYPSIVFDTYMNYFIKPECQRFVYAQYYTPGGLNNED